MNPDDCQQFAHGKVRTSDALVVGKPTVEEYLWQEVCRGWTLASHDALHVVLEEMPPGTHEVRHYHSSTIQFYFVLSGTAVVLLGDRALTITPGNGIEIVPLVPHQMRNEGNTTLEFLVISSKAPRGDRTDLQD